MFYPMPIILHHGNSEIEYVYPTWVSCFTFIGIVLALGGLLGILGAFVVEILSNKECDDDFVLKLTAICLIGVMILIVSVILMMITGKPIE